ncbi:SDR family oxidoreductase [Anaerobacillus alkaliphilus]|uniref:SDR family oxidoreductase n=1 Tax=Anaerobacillus alkaliphilus TaxID=1548597 RepID=A0A4Q0VXI9_9BACI|nr:glucose 1-dehydrogenase [Anaerobacillus alkaliphilus]RXJ03818.1 SDR family oxidoreductase [Anaerobacillus alkaliphilus]
MDRKVVVVTGGANGIGKEIARQYGGNRYLVVIADRDEAQGQHVTAQIIADGGEALVIKTDVSVPSNIEELFNKVHSSYGRVDVLINNAGISKWGSPYDLAVSEWDYIINTNLRSVFLCSREAAKMMRDNGGGSIVNIASTRAIMSEPNSEAYAASKGGILSLTHALAASLGTDNIRVNVVSPGWIETGNYDELRETDHQQHLTNRVGRPSDVAKACLYLTAEDNDFITGTNIIIDGGMTRKMIYEE